MEEKLDIYRCIARIQQEITTLYGFLHDELKQDWKNFTITIDGEVFEINSDTPQEKIDKVIEELIKDAVCAFIDITRYPTTDTNPFSVIHRILNGARKEDHQIEIIKEEHVVDLDEQGNPIKAKPLNMNSIYVQWQDESKFELKPFDEIMKTRLTEEEIETIESEAIQELKEMQ